MIFFGCPVDIRHISRIAGDQIRRWGHTFSPKSAVKIHFVYFSCAQDMPLLTLSLKSLMALHCSKVGMVYVVVDSKGPFSPEQQIKIQEIIPKLEFLHLGKIDWASTDTLQTEISAFTIAAQKAQPLDFVAKVDSDILFFSKSRLEELSVCAADFVGDGHYSNYEYAQGGLYFMRAPLAASLITSATDKDLSHIVNECNTVAEDQIISALVKKRTRKIWLTRLMLFPGEFEKANLKKRCVRHEFTAIHFVHRKVDITEYANRIEII